MGFFFFLFFKYKNSQVSPPPKSLREVGAPPTFKVPSAGLGLLPEGPGKKQGAAPPRPPSRTGTASLLLRGHQGASGDKERLGEHTWGESQCGVGGGRR